MTGSGGEKENDFGKNTPGGPVWHWLNESAAMDAKLMNVLRSLARPLGNTPEEREEAARELFTITAGTALDKERRGEYDSAQAVPRTFFFGIARNVALRLAEERKRNTSADTFRVPGDSGDATELWEQWTPLRPGFESKIIDRDWIDGLVAQLGDEEQKTIRLGLLEGLTGEDLAAALAVNPGTARTRFSRAMKRLAQIAHTERQREDGALQAGSTLMVESKRRSGGPYGPQY